MFQTCGVLCRMRLRQLSAMMVTWSLVVLCLVLCTGRTVDQEARCHSVVNVRRVAALRGVL